ncbi:MAG: hypothetical protein BHW65_10165 [Verrucomicrobia bacterium CAG:312_58_20]|nr:MAG: hypothetical protein BHW65_10165 [Verrucomicrobia bacterium CAG:312_58_20]
MKAIDAHAHLRKNAKGFDKIAESGAFEEIWLMDLSGVRLNGVEFASQREILRVSKDFKGRVRAFGHLDLDGAADQPDRLADAGFAGLKPYKPRFPYSDERYFPIYERAQALKMPVLFHTGLVAKGPAWDGEGGGRSFGPVNMQPQYLAAVAEAFPDLKIMQGHLGWPHLEQTEQNLYYYKNITCDVSGFRRLIGDMPAFFDKKCNDGSARPRFFNHKTMFATDQFYGEDADNRAALKILEFWKLYFELVGSVYWRWGQPEEAEKFFRSNAAEIREYCGWQ